jgi:hypothetical protein
MLVTAQPETLMTSSKSAFSRCHATRIRRSWTTPPTLLAAPRAMASTPAPPRSGERLVAAVALVGHGDPVAAVIAEADVVALALHAGDDVADPAPRIEAAVQELQLGLARRHEREADGGAKEAGAWERVPPRRAPARLPVRVRPSGSGRRRTHIIR